MYRFSRAIFTEIKDLVDPASRHHLGRGGEASRPAFV